MRSGNRQRLADPAVQAGRLGQIGAQLGTGMPDHSSPIASLRVIDTPEATHIRYRIRR